MDADVATVTAAAWQWPFVCLHEGQNWITNVPGLTVCQSCGCKAGRVCAVLWAEHSIAVCDSTGMCKHTVRVLCLTKGRASVTCHAKESVTWLALATLCCVLSPCGTCFCCHLVTHVAAFCFAHATAPDPASPPLPFAGTALALAPMSLRLLFSCLCPPACPAGTARGPCLLLQAAPTASV